MESLLPKSEFLRRIRAAVRTYEEKPSPMFRPEMLQLSVDAAKKCGLPATLIASDPITSAIIGLGAPRARGDYGDPVYTMVLVESAWEHFLHDEEARKTFKELNP